MSDEERRNNRTGAAEPGHDHPEEQPSERQQRGQTPVRLAGFPEPPSAPPVEQQADPEKDSSEEKRTSHTNDDLSDELAHSSTADVAERGISERGISQRGISEGAVSEEKTTGLPEDEARDRADGDANGESSESRHRHAGDRQQANGGARSSGARLVVPASRPSDDAGTPRQQKPAPGQPAAEDESECAASAQAQDDLGRDVVRSEKQAHTAPESADTADSQDRPSPPSQRDQSISASNSPGAADRAPQPAASETPSARNRAAQRRRTPGSTNASHQQIITDPAAGTAPREEPPGRGPVAPTSGGGGESYNTGESRSRTEPSRRQRTSKARGRSKIPWRKLPLAVALIVVLGAGAAGALALWPATEQEGSGATNQPQPQDGAEQSEQAAGSSATGQGSEVGGAAIRDTGVAFEALSVEGSGDDGSGDRGSGESGEGESETVDVSLAAAVAGGEEMVWTGTASGAAGEGEDSLQQSPQAARSISLSGEGSPTSANFQAGFEMPTAVGTDGGDGEVQSGVMARTEAGEPVTHATYQRLGPAEGEPGPSNVSAQGSYYIADDEGVLAEGSYTDRREEGSGRVVRTYTEDNPATGGGRTFRVSFEAPPETPIPTLVGWQPPDERG